MRPSPDRAELVEVRPHDFEGRELGTEAQARAPQQLENPGIVFQRTDARVDAARLREESEHDAGDHAQRALGADEKLPQVVARIVLDHLAHRVDDRAIGQHRLDAEHEIARHAEAQHTIAARVGREVAADLARAATAKVQRKEQIRRIGGLLHGLHHDAGFDSDRSGRDVQLLDGAHALERQHDTGTQRNTAARKACHTALWLNGDSALVAEFQDRRDLLRAARIGEREDIGLRIGRNTEVMRMPNDILRIRRNDDVRPHPLHEPGNHVVLQSSCSPRMTRDASGTMLPKPHGA